MENLSAEMQECITNCLNCHSMCLSMATNHCLQMGGAHVEPEHFRLMLDCAEICQTAANFMLRSSKHHPHVCAECADVCENCAQSCEEVGDMDECVEACRRCAETCGQMAKTAVS